MRLSWRRRIRGSLIKTIPARATRLGRARYDTYLRGVRAYSTWVILATHPVSMLAYDDTFLINTIIHEMLHQLSGQRQHQFMKVGKFRR